MKYLRAIVVCLLGGIGGALLGALVLGAATYTAEGLDYFGRPVSVWTGAAAGAGAIYGSAPGAVVGLAVAISEFRRSAAVLLGAAIGLLMVFPQMLVFIFEPGSLREVLFLVAPIPLGGLLGLFLTFFKAFGLGAAVRKTASLNQA